jgi:hypothetical protein
MDSPSFLTALDICVIHSMNNNRLGIEQVSILKAVSKAYNDMLNVRYKDSTNIDLLSVSFQNSHNDKIISTLSKNCFNGVQFYKEIYRLSKIAKRYDTMSFHTHVDTFLSESVLNIFNTSKNSSLTYQCNTISLLLSLAETTEDDSIYIILYMMFYFMKKLFAENNISYMKNKQTSVFAYENFYNTVCKKIEYYKTHLMIFKEISPLYKELVDELMSLFEIVKLLIHSM